MTLAISYGTFGTFMFLVSNSYLFEPSWVISAPIDFRIFMQKVISLICGQLSRIHFSSQSIVAATIATAAFLAPLITTSPFSGLPPCITSFSKVSHPLIFLLRRLCLENIVRIMGDGVLLKRTMAVSRLKEYIKYKIKNANLILVKLKQKNIFICSDHLIIVTQS